jgi:hypothetical protein
MDEYEFVASDKLRQRLIERDKRLKLKRDVELAKLNSSLALNEMVMIAVHELGGVEYFMRLGKAYPKEFMQFVSKMIDGQNNAKAVAQLAAAEKDKKPGFSFSMILENRHDVN